MSGLFSLPPEQFALLSAVLGVLLTKNLDANEKAALGDFIQGVGQSISTAASQAELLQERKQKDQHVYNQIKMLKKQICLLEQQLRDQD